MELQLKSLSKIKFEILMKKLLLILLVFSYQFVFAQYPQWAEVSNTSVNGEVRCMIEYNGELVVAGRFTEAGSVSAKSIARWDGSSWSTFADGLGYDPDTNPIGVIHKMVVYNDKLYVAGKFEMSDGCIGNHIAVWNGNQWDDLNSGTNSQVRDLEIYNEELFIAGRITQAGAVEAHEVAKWDGNNWSNFTSFFGTPSTSSPSSGWDFEVFDDKLFMSGGIMDSSQVKHGTVVYYDGNNWNFSMINNTDYVKNLGVYNNTLICGVTYSYSGTGEVFEVYHQMVNDSTWSVFHESSELLFLMGIIEYQNDFCVFGADENVLQDPIAPRIWKLNSAGEWEGFGGTGISGVINDAILFNDELYVGGSFNEDNGGSFNYIAKLLTHPVHVNEFEVEWDVFLNPSGKSIQIVVDIPHQIQTLQLVDVQGKVVYSEQVLSNQKDYFINVSLFTKGSYFLQLTDQLSQTTTKKVVVH